MWVNTHDISGGGVRPRASVSSLPTPHLPVCPSCVRTAATFLTQAFLNCVNESWGEGGRAAGEGRATTWKQGGSRSSRADVILHQKWPD